ncbi:MAG: hypothetical protein WCE62_14180 [Polyangiales bacterium]
MMLRAGIVFLALAIPNAVDADARGQAKTESDPRISLRTPRLDIGLLSTEAPMFTATAVWLFVLAAQEARYDCSQGSFCIFPQLTGAYVVTGLATLGMSAWALRLLSRSVGTLRSRRANVIDYDGSIRFNRRIIAYDTIMTGAYLGVGVGVSLGAAQGENRASVTGPILGAAAALLGLHLWSLIRNVKELKHSKRVGIDPPSKARRLKLIGNGVGW